MNSSGVKNNLKPIASSKPNQVSHLENIEKLEVNCQTIKSELLNRDMTGFGLSFSETIVSSAA